MIFIEGLKDFRADKEKKIQLQGSNSTDKLYLGNASTGLHAVEVTHGRSLSRGNGTGEMGFWEWEVSWEDVVCLL